MEKTVATLDRVEPKKKEFEQYIQATNELIADKKGELAELEKSKNTNLKDKITKITAVKLEINELESIKSDNERQLEEYKKKVFGTELNELSRKEVNENKLKIYRKYNGLLAVEVEKLKGKIQELYQQRETELNEFNTNLLKTARRVKVFLPEDTLDADYMTWELEMLGYSTCPIDELERYNKIL